jgi:hypothetical protein
MEYTQREKELISALISTAKALGRLIEQTQPGEHDHPEYEILERAFETIGNHSTENLF